MHKTAVKLGVSATLALLMPFAQAAGLGRLTVNSALGQPLAAQIELVSVTRDELNSLAARLASPDAYRQANLQFQPDLNALRFSIQQRPGAQPVILISSTRPVNEPVVDLLVELAWASGRISRAYTVLIDPPTERQSPATAPIAPPAPPVVATEPRPAPAVEPRPAPAESAVARREPEPAEQRRPAARGTVAAAPSAAPAQEYGPVKRGETLAGVATATRPEGVSLEQMLVGLFRSNPDAFDGNMNRLKSGRILRVPEKDAVAAIPPAEALQEIRVQARDWNAYRNRLAETAPAAQEGSAASGRITTRADDQAAGSGPRDVVKLSKTEGVGAGGGKGEAAAKPSPADRLRMLEEEAIAREKALAEAQDRIAQLEKTIREQQKLLALKATPAGTPAAEPAKAPEASKPAADGATPASAPAPTTASGAAQAESQAPASAPAPVSEPAPQAVAKPPVAPPPPPAPEPEFLDLLLEEPLYVGAGAGVLLLALLLSVMRRRRAAAGVPRREPVAPASVMPAAAAGAAGAAAFVAADEPPAATREPEPLDLDLLPEPEPEAEPEPVNEPAPVNADAAAATPTALSAVEEPAGKGVEPAVTPEEPVVEATPAPAAAEPPAAPAGVLPDFEFELPAPDEPTTVADVTPEPVEAPTAVTESNVIDFNLDLPEVEPEQEPPVSADTTPAPDAAANGLDFKLDFGDIDLNLDEPAAPAAGVDKEPHWHDVQQKFDLAKAYEEMGDKDGAREVLQEVLNEGDEEQRSAARKLLDTLV